MTTSKSHWPLTLTGGFVSLVNLLLPLVLVRILPPQAIGQYKVFFLYLALVPWLFLTAGVTNGLSHWAGHEDKLPAAVRGSWSILVAIAAVTLVLGLGLSGPASGWLEWDLTKTALLAWGAAAAILASFFDDWSIASGRITRGAFFNAGFDLCRNLAMAAAALRFRTLESVLWTHVTIVTSRIAVGATWGYLEGFQRPAFDRKALRGVIRYALPVSVAAALGIATGYADQILLSNLLPPEQFAVYSFGCLLVPPLLIFEQSVNRVMIPLMSRAFARNSPARAMHLFRDGVSELGWLLIPAALGLIMFSRPIITLLFTETYAGAAFFLRLYAINYIFQSLPYDSVARAHGDGPWILRTLAVFSALAVASVGVGAASFGAAGALLATVGTGALMRVSSMWRIHRKEGWPLAEMLPWMDWLRYVVSGAVAAGVGYALRRPLGGGLQWFLAGGAAFAAVYLVGTYSTFQRRRAELAAANT